MRLRITTLSENTAGFGKFLGEWGLSILVETDDISILLDTGQRISATYNADILGIDLSKIDRIILSHGHFDHTGGLSSVLNRMKKEVEIIAHPNVWQDRYWCPVGQPVWYIGIPYRRQMLENLGAKFNLTKEPVKITERIMTTGEVPMVTEYEEMEPQLQVKEGSKWLPDRVPDDQALVINTELGLVVVLGCAHHGIINTLYHAQKLTGVEQIHMVMGGCHLGFASQERIRLTIAALEDLGVQRVGVSHCTGLPAAMEMAHQLGDRFFFNNAGAIVELF